MAAFWQRVNSRCSRPTSSGIGRRGHSRPCELRPGGGVDPALAGAVAEIAGREVGECACFGRGRSSYSVVRVWTAWMTILAFSTSIPPSARACRSRGRCRRTPQSGWSWSSSRAPATSASTARRVFDPWITPASLSLLTKTGVTATHPREDAPGRQPIRVRTRRVGRPRGEEAPGRQLSPCRRRGRPPPPPRCRAPGPPDHRAPRPSCRRPAPALRRAPRRRPSRTVRAR